MKRILIVDAYHQRSYTLNTDLSDIIFEHSNNPTSFIRDLIEKEVELQGFNSDKRVPLKEKVIDFLKNHGVITTSMGIKAGIITQSIQLQQAISTLARDGIKIGRISDRKPYLYYYGIDPTEAMRRTIQDTHLGSTQLELISHLQEGLENLILHHQWWVKYQGGGGGYQNVKDDMVNSKVTILLDRAYGDIPLLKGYEPEEIIETINNGETISMMMGVDK